MRNYQSWKEVEAIIRADAKKDETIEKSNHTCERCFITFYGYNGYCTYEENGAEWRDCDDIGRGSFSFGIYLKPYRYAIKAKVGNRINVGRDITLKLTENEPTEEDIKSAIDYFHHHKGYPVINGEYFKEIKETYIVKLEMKEDKLPVARFFFLPRRAAKNAYNQVSVCGTVAVFPMDHQYYNALSGFAADEYDGLNANFRPHAWAAVCNEWCEERICKVNFKTTALAKRWIKSNSWVIAYNSHDVVAGDNWQKHSWELSLAYYFEDYQYKRWHFNRGENGRERIKQIVNDPYAAVARKK